MLMVCSAWDTISKCPTHNITLSVRAEEQDDLNMTLKQPGEYLPLMWDGHPEYEMFYGHVDLETCFLSWEDEHDGRTTLRDIAQGIDHYYCKITPLGVTLKSKPGKRGWFPVTCVNIPWEQSHRLIKDTLNVTNLL